MTIIASWTISITNRIAITISCTWSISLSLFISIFSTFWISTRNRLRPAKNLYFHIEIRLYHLFYKVPIIVVERPSVLEVSMRLIAQSLTILPYRSRYSSPHLYYYKCLVIKALREFPQFKGFKADLEG